MKKTMLLFFVSLLAESAFCDSELIGDIEWRYTKNVGCASVGGGDYNSKAIPYSTAGDILIPSMLGGYPVTGIANYAFSGCWNVTRATIPYGVTSIGDSAFQDCSNMSSVAIPQTVVTIGDYAFAYCGDLESVSLPSGVSSTGNYTFQNCGLESVMIPWGVVKIGNGAFSGCYKLSAITVPDSVATIGDYAFSSCSTLKTIDIPSSVHSFGESVFHGCSGLTAVTLPIGVTSIPRWTFYYCTGLKTFKIPSNINTICECAFQGCSSLTTITIPSSVEHIKTNAFCNCSILSSVYVDDGDSQRVRQMLSGSGLDTSKITFVDAGVEIPHKDMVVTMVITNVVIHYIINSVQSTAVSPVTSETRFVNVITEIKGGNVAVPDSWAKNYPNFVSTFGDDFTAALMKPTKKKDGANNPMLVWQDYVAGTDPTKEDDVFKASITKDKNGKIIISYTPEFKDEAEKAKRKYTTLGKKSLMDAVDWEVVPEGREADYNFFKVTVEMQSIQSK